MTRLKSEKGWLIVRGLLLPLMAAGLCLIYTNLDKSPLVDKLYTLQLSRWILSGISTVTRLLPFSLAEILAPAVVLGLVVNVVRLAVALLRRQEILPAFFRITNVLALLTIGFLLFWGFNYRQIGLEQVMGLMPRQISVKDLEAMGSDLAEQAKTERAQAGFSETSRYRVSGDLSSGAQDAYEKLSFDHPEFRQPVGRAKPLLSSRLFSYLGISGIFAPYTAEANYNNDQQDLLKAASVLHELAHLKGVAREEEANFTAYLASRYSDDPAFRYSGTMLALINTTNRLAKTDLAAFHRVNALFSDGMRLDLTAHNNYWEQFEGEVREKAEQVNDQYLKTNGQSQGVAAYEDMVSYLFAFQEKTGSVNLIK